MNIASAPINFCYYYSPSSFTFAFEHLKQYTIISHVQRILVCPSSFPFVINWTTPTKTTLIKHKLQYLEHTFWINTKRSIHCFDLYARDVFYEPFLVRFAFIRLIRFILRVLFLQLHCRFNARHQWWLSLNRKCTGFK